MTASSTDTPRPSRSTPSRAAATGFERALPPELRGWLGWAIAISPIIVTAYLLIHRLHGPIGINQPIGTDLVLYWDASRAFLMHHQVYASHFYGNTFVYPPASLLIFWPLSFLSLRLAMLSFFVVDAAAIVFGGAIVFRLFRLPLRSPQGAVSLFVFTCAMPVQTTLFNGNVNGIILLLLAACLLLAARQRWARAALCLGMSLAVKPILILIVLVFGLRRRWPSVLLALLVPVVLCLAMLPFLIDGSTFITRAVPWLLGGTGPTYQAYNVSLAGAGASLGLPSVAMLPVRALVLVIVVGLGWRIARRDGDISLQVIELAGLLVLLTVLDFSYAWPYYTIYLLPLFVAVFRKGSLVRSVPAMIGFFLMCSPDILLMQAPYYDGAGGIASVLFKLSIIRQTVGMLVLLTAMTWRDWRNHGHGTAITTRAERRQHEAATVG